MIHLQDWTGQLWHYFEYDYSTFKDDVKSILTESPGVIKTGTAKKHEMINFKVSKFRNSQGQYVFECYQGNRFLIRHFPNVNDIDRIEDELSFFEATGGDADFMGNFLDLD